MAIATKTKPKAAHHKKRTAGHHSQGKHYVKSYWPYLPLLAIVAGGLLLNGSIGKSGTVLGDQSNLSQQALLESTNSNRIDNAETSLALNTQLSQAAQAKAADMVSQNYWSHKTPSGQEPWTFVTSTGYQYQAVGENLAYGFSDSQATLSAWMHSETHRANVLNKNYTQVGFGVAQSPNYVGSGPETVVVAMYAEPATSTTTNVSATVLPSESGSVSRVQTISFSPAASNLVIALIGTLAVIAVLFRHGIAWRKLLNRGEAFAIAHPFLDMALISLAMLAVILNHTAGFIH